MDAEIISVGTELLLGQIVNTNAAYIAQKLATLGINTYYQTVVGDNPKKLTEVIKIAEERSDLLIFIGGLGPTQDDLTKETVAKHLNEPLILEPASLQHIRHYFEKQGRIMTENNPKQAYYFQNGRYFKNIVGHAIGSYFQKDKNAYLFVPGPPREMKPMFDDEIHPYLETIVGKKQQFIVSNMLHFYGIGESMLSHTLHDLIENQTNPTLATYAGAYEVSLRITASGEDEETCRNLLFDMEKEVLSLVGDYCYGEGEVNTLANVVETYLADQGLSISVAESLTGGLFQAELVSVPKCGQVFRGGIVAYEEGIKRDVLQVPRSILENDGMVSEACAKSMATNCLKMFDTDIAISFTGAAGPDSLEGHPPGTVWIGIAQKNGDIFAKKYQFVHDREGNRARSVKQGLYLLYKILSKK